MAKKDLVAIGNESFEELKKVNEHGAEYWSARELQPLLGYTQWRRFEDAINRALTSCKQSGNTVENHFAGAGKMVKIGSTDGYQDTRKCRERSQRGNQTHRRHST